MRRLALAMSMLIFVLAFAPASFAQQPREYGGTCDASAAIALDSKTFVVANDEDNILRVYARDGGATPMQEMPLDSSLKVDPEEPEADIEGVTRMGTRVLWVTSHGQNKKGKKRSSRHRLFAMEFAEKEGRFSATLVGSAYRNLRDDLVATPAFDKFKLAEAAKLPPEAPGGFNIEGLSATADGRLFVGFRNPIPDGKALIISIENPENLLAGEKPIFGPPIQIDLQGKGIRSMEYFKERNAFLIVGGPYDDNGSFAAFSWSGNASDAPTLVKDVDFGDNRPEAMFTYTGERDTVEFLSDDGGRKFDKLDCKDASYALRRFRRSSHSIRQ